MEYYSIIARAIEKTFFFAKCEAWRERDVAAGVYNDVYDGQIWKDFTVYNGVPFLSAPFNYVFHLNVDWFQPFEHTQHSEGAIYLTIMNLPRKERSLQENVVLIGVIPGPSEPHLHINSMLKPLVDELQQLWTGVCMKTAEGCSVLVRAALLCIGCDIPAARKVCGFLGHRATKGCSKCLSAFPTVTFGDKADYSNFDRTSWISRTKDSHKEYASKYRDCNTHAAQRKIEQEYGTRYSILLELTYFDAPRMCIVDPMHNLLLGTAKHMVDIWKNAEVLTNKDLDVIQKRVDDFFMPSDVGRVPSKISSSFSGFTAEQWKS